MANTQNIYLWPFDGTMSVALQKLLGRNTDDLLISFFKAATVCARTC